MNDLREPLKWLRRGLVAFVGLLALVLTSGLVCLLLSSMGDSVGARAFRIVTLVAAIADLLCGIALLIGTVRTQIMLVESQSSQSK